MITDKLQLLFMVALLSSVIGTAVVQQIKINIDWLNGVWVNLFSLVLNALLVVCILIGLCDYKILAIENYAFIVLAVIVAFGGADLIYKTFKEKLEFFDNNNEFEVEDLGNDFVEKG